MSSIQGGIFGVSVLCRGAGAQSWVRATTATPRRREALQLAPARASVTPARRVPRQLTTQPSRRPSQRAFGQAARRAPREKKGKGLPRMWARQQQDRSFDADEARGNAPVHVLRGCGSDLVRLALP